LGGAVCGERLVVNSHGIVGFAALQEEIAYTLGYTDMAKFRRAF
jgi:hypothetical protein